MLTFTNAISRTTSITGVGTDTNSINEFKADLNQGLRIFKNSARRYWSRVDKSTNLVASQQYYTLPEDCVRITQVKIVSNGFVYPLEEISSEHKWNQLNILPTATINVPQYFFVRGRNEVGVWPQPSANVTGGLDVSYEPRMYDMSLDDVSTGTVTVTNGSTAVVGAGTAWAAYMVGEYFTVTDGTDGLWYKIAAVTDATHLTIENFYQGLTGAGRAATVGSVADIPEDFHMALVYYACYNFFLKRKDIDVANSYMQQFNMMLGMYKQAYGSKTTGVVVSTSMSGASFNQFTMPPNAIS